ncbi:MAG: glycosyltransferase family 9 protein [Bacteroidia bacterium]|nr:glycosyltransferase family 9 protein [Bacteroidia bacterium]MBT8275605.1 glycosyltransferase family 9 protein [Bacteroidia bacterium]NNF31530.1 glycosyltransferase family 9 protein [Flavobacteriaceae bacterium]NNK54109.1 glycosyltransferase family 9 protein [Flavobacteriaceae bacterium]NNM07686.1 glycosyltransferase family 9 protein [Flavobacteriaceae bacterium]
MTLPTHILVIRFSALGDVAMTVPVLRVVTAAYPEIKITVVSKNQYAPLFDDVPGVQFLEADVYGRHKGFGLFKLASEAKELGIDAVADLHNVIRSKIVRSTLWGRGIKTTAIDKGRAEKKKLTVGQNRELAPLKSTHQRYADVFMELGLKIDLDTHVFPAAKDISPRIHHFFGSQPKKAIGIAPFAAYTSKMYPLQMMKEVIARLDSLGDYKIFLLGAGAEEADILKSIELEHKNVLNVADQLTFGEELSLISNLDLMVSMDSSNGHLAAMYGVPVITMWGVTHPCLGFTPFEQPAENQLLTDREKFPLIPTSVYGNSFPVGYENAMETITPSVVIAKIQEIIEH